MNLIAARVTVPALITAAVLVVAVATFITTGDTNTFIEAGKQRP